MLGVLCKEADVKFFVSPFGRSGYPIMAYSMTKEESDQTAIALRKLADNSVELYPKYKEFLSKKCDANDFKEIILAYAKDFEDSEGYECI